MAREARLLPTERKTHTSPHSPRVPLAPRTVEFTVPGNPLSLNHAFPSSRSGRRFPSPELKRWKQAIQILATVARQGEPIFDGPVAVSLHLYFSSRRPDLDNAIKPILDGLKGATLKDDRQVTEIRAVKGLDKANPRAEVRVWSTGASS